MRIEDLEHILENSLPLEYEVLGKQAYRSLLQEALGEKTATTSASGGRSSDVGEVFSYVKVAAEFLVACVAVYQLVKCRKLAQANEIDHRVVEKSKTKFLKIEEGKRIEIFREVIRFNEKDDA